MLRNCGRRRLYKTQIESLKKFVTLQHGKIEINNTPFCKAITLAILAPSLNLSFINHFFKNIG